MKLIILNRRKIGVTIIIIGLMIVLFGFEKKLDGRLKFTALMQSDITSLKQYKALDGLLTYKLPAEWETKEADFESSEVIYHNDFQSKDAVIHGFVEIWSLKENLKDFLDRSMELFKHDPNYMNYSLSPIKINGHEGYLLTYIMKTRQNAYFRGYEYFVKDTEKFLRFSFFVRNENFKENTPTIFKTIVETFKYNPRN